MLGQPDLDPSSHSDISQSVIEHSASHPAIHQVSQDADTSSIVDSQGAGQLTSDKVFKSNLVKGLMSLKSEVAEIKSVLKQIKQLQVATLRQSKCSSGYLPTLSSSTV